MTSDWHHFPPIELPSPGLVVLPGRDGLWAGGLAGVGRYSAAAGWVAPVSGSPPGPVSALAFGAECLFAGGAGTIARSRDRGRSWRPSAIPDGTGTIAAITLSPRFPEDGTALAATLDNGVLRSLDAGQTWQTSAFGLRSHEVLALAWGRGETVMAATTAGLHRSPNAGRAWRVCAETAGTAFVALAVLPDGTALAAPDVGPLWQSTDNLAPWSTVTGLPEDLRTWALTPLTEGRVLLSSENHGMLLSPDRGMTWLAVSPERAVSLAADHEHVFAGTSAGVAISADGGRSWTHLPPAPLHDLRRLLLIDGVAVVAGTNSPPVVGRPGAGWTPLDDSPRPLAGLFRAPDRAIFGSSPDGLFRSADLGATWNPVITGREGCVSRMTFLPDGCGWSGGDSDTQFLRTPDGGRTWTRLPWPFGVLPLVALQAVPRSPGRATAGLLAATYDDRQRSVAIWRSDDGGERWARGGDFTTPWPLVATGDRHTLVAVGNVITVQAPDGQWRQSTLGGTGVRRVVGDGETLIALNADSILRSDDHGTTWVRDDAGIPADEILDVDLDSRVLYALLTAGRLWSRPL